MDLIKNALNLLTLKQTASFRLPENSVLVVAPNAIVIRFFKESYGPGEMKQEVLAARIGEAIVGNSSALTELVRHREVSGSRRNVVAVDEQLVLAELIPMIPFGVLKQAGLDLNSYRELDKTAPETVLRKMDAKNLTEFQLKSIKDLRPIDLSFERAEDNWRDKTPRWNATYFVKQHFAGARLFQCSRGEVNTHEGVERKTFLLDLDRRELEHGILNPFLVELKFEASTIVDAYEGLKPDLVKSAASFKRQGEWFFVPVDELTAKRAQVIADKRVADVKASGESRFGIAEANRGVLRAGPNRPNRVETMVEIDGIHFVRGIVSHDGREHADLRLKSWHRAIPNTATTSWTITGDVD